MMFTNPKDYIAWAKDTFAKEYHYFNFPAMLEPVSIVDSAWTEAMHLLAEQKIILESVKLNYREPRRVDLEGICVCRAFDGTGNDRVEIAFNGEGLRYIYCTFRNYYNQMNRLPLWNGDPLELMDYEVAAMILLGEHLLRENPGDSTSFLGNRLIHFSKEAKGAVPGMADALLTAEEGLVDVVAEEPPLQLVPQLKMNRGHLTATFRIGEKKLYKVRNLPDFISIAEQGGSLTLGKKNTFHLTPERFQGDAQVYYEMISSFVHQQEVVDEFRYQKAPNSFRATSTGDSLVLGGASVDQIYEMMERAPIEYVDAEKNKLLLHASEGQLRPDLHLEHVYLPDGTYDGVHFYGSLPDTVQGQQYTYFIEGERFCRTASEEYQKLVPLTHLENWYGEIDVRIGRNHLSDFYYDTLPWLSERMSVDELDWSPVEEMLPPEVKLHFFLDAEYGGATCVLRAKYGEEGIDLTKEVLDPSVLRTMPPGRNAGRNQEKEQNALLLLAEYFPEAIEESAVATGDNDGNLYRLLDTGLDQMLRLGEVQMTDSFRSLNIRRKPRITMGVAMESNLLDLRITGDDIDAAEMSKILQQYKRKKKFYRLKNGDFLKLDSEGFATVDEMMDALHLSPKELAKGAAKIPMYRALYVDKLISEREDIYARRDRNFKALIKEFKTIEDADYDVPESLEDVLRNYQKTGYRWLRTLAEHRFGGILADDMGLGKTLQVITLLLAVKEEQGAKGIADTPDTPDSLDTADAPDAPDSPRLALIAAPASLVFQWKEEIGRFAPSLEVAVIAGSAAERRKQLQALPENVDVVLTSYDLLKRDIANYEDLRFQFEIIDEAQYIKNQNTAAAKAVKLVHAQVRFALTGTPIENRLSELWSIFDYLMPGALYGSDVFRSNFETPIVKHNDENARQHLSRMISPFVLRRCKKDVLQDLPDKLEEVYYAPLEGEQQKLYDAQVSYLKNMLEEGSEADFREKRFAVLAELTKIRQICCEPSLCFENYTGSSSKREACLELVKSAIDGGHRMLIFSQFTSMLDLLEADLVREKIAYYKIVGSTPKQRRLELVHDFNNNQVPVFLISLKAGGFGLNLTGADMVIHYDPWWNVAAQNQATDRTHRIGQTRTVNVYKLIAKGTVEEKILKMQEMKQKLADDILAGDAVSSAAISRDDLLALLRDGR